MFVWVFHRISGLTLILLVGLQIVSGFCQGSASTGQFVQSIAKLHNHALLVCVLVLLFIFHSLYGIRTILMDLGLRHEKTLFWGVALLGIVLFAAFLVFHLSVVAG
jgi:succinate dehydrogenase / fumarate reductase cytochrome b subunit